MAHYALLDSNSIVVQVITGRDEDEVVNGISDWESHYSELTGLRAVRTSFNTHSGLHHIQDENGIMLPDEDQSKSLRKNFAGIGYTYDEARDAFIPPKPYDSWTLNENTCQWDTPEGWQRPWLQE